MGDFNSMFPNFLTQCLSLKTLLTPVAFLLITGGLIASTIAHHRSGNAQLQAIGKVIVLIMLIVFLPTWGNQIVSIVDDTVKNVLKVDPAKIHDQYQAALQIKKSSDGNTSWWDKLVNFPASMVEALMSVAFIILGWLASTIEWWAYILQSAILFIGYSLSPIFIGMLAFPSLQQTGRNYLLNLVGVMIWPLGWGVAGLVTQGMIDFMTDQSFLSSSSAPNTLYSLQNLMGLAFLGHLDYFQHDCRAHRHSKGDNNGTVRRFQLVQRRCLCGPGGGNGWRDHFCRRRRSRNQEPPLPPLPPRKHW
jgi:hypothetical protein